MIRWCLAMIWRARGPGGARGSGGVRQVTTSEAPNRPRHRYTSGSLVLAHRLFALVSPDIERLLDNPVWSCLTTRHAHLALGGDAARRYPPEISPITGFPDTDRKSTRLHSSHTV